MYNPIKEFGKLPVYNTIVTGLGVAAVGLSIAANNGVKSLVDEYLATTEMQRGLQTVMWADGKQMKANQGVIKKQFQVIDSLASKLSE